MVTAAAATALSPALAAMTATLTTTTFEPLAWTGCAYFIARYIVRREANSLLWAGAVAGLAMEAKYGIVMWLAGLFLGLLLFHRDVFLTKKLWLGTALAGLIAAPSLVWQAVHHWPFLALIAHHRAIGFDLTGRPLVFEIGQILANNLVLAPLWIAGVIAPFVIERVEASAVSGGCVCSGDDHRYCNPGQGLLPFRRVSGHVCGGSGRAVAADSTLAPRVCG